MTDLISRLRDGRWAGLATALAAAPLMALAAPERAAAQETTTYTATVYSNGPPYTQQFTGYDRAGPNGIVYVNPLAPGGVNEIYLLQTSNSLEFAPPTTTTTLTTDYATEIIAELNGNTISNSTYSGLLGGASAQGGVAAADAALRAAGGATTAVGALALQQSNASSSSTSSTLYSVAGVSLGTNETVVIGPASLTAYQVSLSFSLPAPYVMDPNAGIVDSCGVSATSAPSSVRPSCEAVDSVPIFVPAGDDSALLQDTYTYTIATTTTIADVTTDTSVYVIDATTPSSAVPEPSTWAMMLAGLATLGLVAQGRRGRARAA